MQSLSKIVVAASAVTMAAGVHFSQFSKDDSQNSGLVQLRSPKNKGGDDNSGKLVPGDIPKTKPEVLLSFSGNHWIYQTCYI